MEKFKTHTGLASKVSRTLAKKLGLSETTVRPDEIQPSVITTAIRRREPGRQIGVPRIGIQRLGCLLGGAMYHISKSFRSNAGIKTSTATLTRGKYDVGTGGGSNFLNNGWRRTVYQPKSTSKIREHPQLQRRIIGVISARRATSPIRDQRVHLADTVFWPPPLLPSP